MSTLNELTEIAQSWLDKGAVRIDIVPFEGGEAQPIIRIELDDQELFGDQEPTSGTIRDVVLAHLEKGKRYKLMGRDGESDPLRTRTVRATEWKSFGEGAELSTVAPAAVIRANEGRLPMLTGGLETALVAVVVETNRHTLTLIKDSNNRADEMRANWLEAERDKNDAEAELSDYEANAKWKPADIIEAGIAILDSLSAAEPFLSKVFAGARQRLAEALQKMGRVPELPPTTDSAQPEG